MSTLSEEIKQTVLNLPDRERIALAGALLKSVPEELPESEEEVQVAWEQEISRRIGEIDSGTVEGIPAEEVFRKLDEKHGWKS